MAQWPCGIAWLRGYTVVVVFSVQYHEYAAFSQSMHLLHTDYNFYCQRDLGAYATMHDAPIVALTVQWR